MSENGKRDLALLMFGAFIGWFVTTVMEVIWK